VIAHELPSVLTPTNGWSAISMARALKQVKELLENVVPDDSYHQDRLNASIDDVEVMLHHIHH
jgi:hypothetical protein